MYIKKMFHKKYPLIKKVKQKSVKRKDNQHHQIYIILKYSSNTVIEVTVVCCIVE